MAALSIILISVSLSMLAACGGGGGGSSNSNNSQSAQTGIRIINASLDYPALQINSGVTGVLSSAEFGAVAYHGGLEAGPVNIFVSTVSNPISALWSASTELVKGQHKSVLVYAGYKESDLRFSLLNDVGVNPGSQAAIRIVNGLANSSQISASVIGLVSTGLASVGSASEYSFLPAGTYEFIVSSNGNTVGKVSGSVQSGASYSVVSQGAADYFITTNLLQD